MNVVVIAPHPDDEAIGCGGSICLQAERGNRVVVVFLTSGELGLKKRSHAEVWKIREQEAESAAAVLGVAALSFLRRPDCHVGHDVEETPAALRPARRREAPNFISLPHSQGWQPHHPTC